MSFFDSLFGKKDLPYKYSQDLLATKGDKVDTPTSTMQPLIKESSAEVADTMATNRTQESFNLTPIDPESKPYDNWVRDNRVGQSNDPVVIQSPKTKGDKIVTTPANPLGSEFGLRHYSCQPLAPRIPEKEVFAFVVENSKETLKYKKNITNIISQTLERKKDAIFIFVRVGNEQKPFNPMNYIAIKENGVVDSLIYESEDDELPNLASALFYLCNNLNVFASGNFSFNRTKYTLGNCSIVCIGTGECVENKDSSKIISSCIAKLKNMSKLKTFKYFCIKDFDAIKVSSLGFPVIGHIISDYYE